MQLLLFEGSAVVALVQKAPLGGYTLNKRILAIVLVNLLVDAAFSVTYLLLFFLYEMQLLLYWYFQNDSRLKI